MFFRLSRLLWGLVILHAEKANSVLSSLRKKQDKEEKMNSLLKNIWLYRNSGECNTMFLYHMFCGEYKQALNLTDEYTLKNFFIIRAYIKKHVPKKSLGSPEAVFWWGNQGGLIGAWGRTA